MDESWRNCEISEELQLCLLRSRNLFSVQNDQVNERKQARGNHSNDK